MRKLSFDTLIRQSLDQLRERERKQQSARLRLRVTLLRLLKSGESSSIKAACQSIGISSKRGYELWDLYQQNSFDEYLRLHYKARKSKLSTEQQAQLMEKANDGTGFGSQAEARQYLQQEFSVSYTQAGVSLLFQRLQIKAKMPRARNAKADGEAQSEYKKL